MQPTKELTDRDRANLSAAAVKRSKRAKRNFINEYRSAAGRTRADFQRAEEERLKRIYAACH